MVFNFAFKGLKARQMKK